MPPEDPDHTHAQDSRAREHADHLAIWDAINALKDEIHVNGYVTILKEIARRYEQRREVLKFFKRPLSVLSKLGWLVVGAIIWGVANHVFKFWPVGTP